MATLIRSRLVLIIGTVLAVLMLFGGMVVANTTIVSNILSLGSTKLMVQEVALTRVTGLPDQQEVGKEEAVVFFAANLGAEVNRAVLKVRLSATKPLARADIAEIRLMGEGDSSVIPLTLVDDVLEGSLRTGWTVPEGYEGTIKVGVKLLKGAPFASYSIETWVVGVPAGEAGFAVPVLATTPVPASANAEIQATEDKTFSPSSVTVAVGDAVRWQVAGQTPHNITFAATNPTAVAGANFLGSSQSHTAIFAVPGRYAYVCAFHQGMAGEVIVQ